MLGWLPGNQLKSATELELVSWKIFSNSDWTVDRIKVCELIKVVRRFIYWAALEKKKVYACL